MNEIYSRSLPYYKSVYAMAAIGWAVGFAISKLRPETLKEVLFERASMSARHSATKSANI